MSWERQEKLLISVAEYVLERSHICPWKDERISEPEEANENTFLCTSYLLISSREMSLSELDDNLKHDLDIVADNLNYKSQECKFWDDTFATVKFELPEDRVVICVEKNKVILYLMKHYDISRHCTYLEFRIGINKK